MFQPKASSYHMALLHQQMATHTVVSGAGKLIPFVYLTPKKSFLVYLCSEKDWDKFIKPLEISEPSFHLQLEHHGFRNPYVYIVNNKGKRTFIGTMEEGEGLNTFHRLDDAVNFHITRTTLQ